MITKVEYASLDERQILIATHNDKYLLEEQNIKEGNFLIFTDKKPTEIEIEEIKKDVKEVAVTTAYILEDSAMVAELTAILLEDSSSTGEVLAYALEKITELETKIQQLQGGIV